MKTQPGHSVKFERFNSFQTRLNLRSGAWSYSSGILLSVTSLRCWMGALSLCAVPLSYMRYDMSVTFLLLPKCWCDGVSSLFRITVCSVWTKASSSFSQKTSFFSWWRWARNTRWMKRKTEQNTTPARERRKQRKMCVCFQNAPKDIAPLSGKAPKSARV